MDALLLGSVDENLNYVTGYLEYSAAYHCNSANGIVDNVVGRLAARVSYAANPPFADAILLLA